MPTIMTPNMPAMPCTETAPTASSMPALTMRSKDGLMMAPPTAPIRKASGGYQKSRPAAAEMIPASAPDIIQNGSRVVAQAPMMPPAKLMSVLKANDDKVAGWP